MSILSTIESLWAKDETWILNLLMKIKAGEQAAQHDVQIALSWVAAHADEISNDMKALQAILMVTGIGLTPQAQAAIVAANVAVAGINAFAAKVNSGESQTEGLVAGYLAAKDAEAAHAVAAKAMIEAQTPK